MAASSAFCSVEWIQNIALFKACIEAGYAEKSSLESFIQPEYVDNVLKGLKQFFYWTRRLQDSRDQAVLTFALIGKEGLVKPDIQSFQKKIVSILGPGHIKNINYPENANFVSLIMSCPVAAQKVRQEVVDMNGALVCYIENRPYNTYKVRVLWSPISYPLEGVIQSLKTWCENVSIKFEEDIFSNGEVIVTNRVSGNINLKEGLSLSQLPHIVKLAGTNTNYVLLVVKERKPLCLKCRIEGHVRKFCPYSKCSKCFILHETNGICPPKTFATIVGKIKQTEEERKQTEFSLVQTANEVCEIGKTESYAHVMSNSRSDTEIVADKDKGISEQDKSQLGKEGEWLQTKGPAAHMKHGTDDKVHRHREKSSSASFFTTSNRFSALENCMELEDESFESTEDEVMDAKKAKEGTEGKTGKIDLSKFLATVNIAEINQGSVALSKRKVKRLKKDGKTLEQNKSGSLENFESVFLNAPSEYMPLAESKVYSNEIENTLLGTECKELDVPDVSQNTIAPLKTICVRDDSGNLHDQVISPYQIVISGNSQTFDLDDLKDFLGDQIEWDYLWNELECGFTGACFSSQEEAVEALSLNGKVWRGEVISVTLVCP